MTKTTYIVTMTIETDRKTTKQAIRQQVLHAIQDGDTIDFAKEDSLGWPSIVRIRVNRVDLQ